MEHITGYVTAGVCRLQGLLGTSIESGFGCVAAKGNSAIKSRRGAGVSQWHLRGVFGMQVCTRYGCYKLGNGIVFSMTRKLSLARLIFHLIEILVASSGYRNLQIADKDCFPAQVWLESQSTSVSSG